MLLRVPQLHHSEKFDGKPWGLFLGPQELEAAGAGAELDALVKVCRPSRTVAASPLPWCGRGGDDLLRCRRETLTG